MNSLGNNSVPVVREGLSGPWYALVIILGIIVVSVAVGVLHTAVKRRDAYDGDDALGLVYLGSVLMGLGIPAIGMPILFSTLVNVNKTVENIQEAHGITFDVDNPTFSKSGSKSTDMITNIVMEDGSTAQVGALVSVKGEVFVYVYEDAVNKPTLLTSNPEEGSIPTP